MPSHDTAPRWIYRLDNYVRALAQLIQARDVLRSSDFRPDVVALLREGLIQRFEYTWELAWKLMKDYLEAGGVAFDVVTPNVVIRAAFAANVVANGEAWMTMLKDRNKMAHTYDNHEFERIIRAVVEMHLPQLEALKAFMLAQKDV